MNKKILLLGLVFILAISFASAELTEDLVAYWSLDNTTGNAIDSLETYNLTEIGTVNSDTGKIDNSRKEYSISNYFRNGAIRVVDVDTTYSTSEWVYIDAITGQGQLATMLGKDTTGYFASRLMVTSSGTINYGHVNSNTLALLSIESSILNEDTWYHIVTTYDGDTKNGTLYINNILIGSEIDTSGANPLANNGITIGWNYWDAGTTSNIPATDLRIDELGYWNRTLTSTEISDLYNSGNGLAYPSIANNFFIIAKSEWDDSSLDTFNLSITNSTGTVQSSTTNGTINTDFNNTYDELVDITVSSTDRFDATYEDWNVSSDLTASLKQSDIKFVIQDPITMINLEGNVTISATTQNNGTSFFLDSGAYTATVSVGGRPDNSNDILITDLQNETLTLNSSGGTAVNLTLGVQNVTIPLSDWNVTVSSSDYGYLETFDGATGLNNIILNLSANISYNISVDAVNFKTNSEIVLPIASTYNFSLQIIQTGYTNVGVIVSDAETSTQLSQNVSFTIDRFTSSSEYTLTNGTGTIIVPELTGTIRFLFQTDGYDNNALDYNFGTASPQFFNLSVLMINSSNPFIISTNLIVKTPSGSPITDAAILMYFSTNGTPTLYASRITDISGSASVSVDTRVSYLMNISASGFSDQTFYLQPTESSYTITMQPLEGFDFANGLGGISYSYFPSNFTLFPVENDFIYSINSSESNLESYTVTLYNGTSPLYFTSGTEPNGSTLSFSYNLSDFVNQSVLLKMSYTADGKSTQYIYKTYLIRDTPTYSGGIFELRDYMQGNLPIKQRVILWVFFLTASALITSLFVKGAILSLLIGIFALIYAGIFAFSLWVIGLMTIFMFIVIVGSNMVDVEGE